MIPWYLARPNPRQYRFALPNEIFQCGLNAAEFAILAYLFRCAGKKQEPPPIRKIMVSLGLCRNTMKKYLRRLLERGFISVLRADDLFSGFSLTHDTVVLTDKLQLRARHFFTMPNMIFHFRLSVGELAVYAYLLFRENRKSFECWPGSKTIGAALGMSKNTVLKYLRRLRDKEFITTEPTKICRRDGTRWNGNLKCHIRPIHSAWKLYMQEKKEEARLEKARFEMILQAAKNPGLHVTVNGTEYRFEPHFQGI